MATLAELETALRNADAAGDTQAATAIAGEYRRMSQAPQPERPGALERGARGIWQGLQDAPDALKQIQSRMAAGLGIPGAADAVKYWDADIKARNDAYKKDVRGGQNDFDFGRLGGNMLFTAPLAVATPAGASLGTATAGGAVTGGLFGALQPVTEGDFGKEKFKQVAAGAGSGALMAPVSAGVSRVISPKSSPEVAMLRSEGVTPTPGQMLGGAFKSAEEKATSLPLVGSAIKAGQTRANEQFNMAAINRALASLGDKLPEKTTGREAIQYAERALGKKYDDALTAIGPVKLDQQLSAELRSVYGALNSLPKDKSDQFLRIMQTELGDRAKTGVLPPEAMKAAESNLGKQARAYMRSEDFDVRQLGGALDDAVTSLRDMVARQAPPGAAAELKAANAGWAQFKRTQRAASYVGAEDGVFSPSQLHAAIRALDRSKDKAQFSRGGALMQDLSSAGKSVLANKIPNSGTTDRALGAAALMSPMLDSGAASVPALAGAGAASLMYTPIGQRMMAAALASRPQGAAGVAEGVRRLSLPAGMALTPAMQSLFSN